MRPDPLDLEDELLLDLDLQQPSSAIYLTDKERIEAACALWSRGVVTVAFSASGPAGGGTLCARVQRAPACASEASHAA